MTLSASRERTSHRGLSAAHYGWLALGACTLAVYGNLIPFRFESRPWAEALATFRHLPFLDPSDLGARGDWVISVFLFAAVSYLLTGALSVDRGRRARLLAAAVVLPFTAALSVGIEFAQVFFPPRTVSLNDIAVETLGGVVGTALWLAGGQRVTRWFRRVEASPSLAVLARRLMPGYLAVLLVALLMPFDFTVSGEELAVKYREGKVCLVPFAHFPLGGKLDLLGNVAGFFPLGFLRALAREGRGGGRRPWLRMLLLGLAVTCLVECLQFFVYSRVFDTTDILTGTAGVWLGWWAARAWRSRQLAAVFRKPAGAGGETLLPRPLAVLLLGSWLAAVLYVNWKPFNFTTDPAAFTSDGEDLPVHGLRRMSLLPFVDYYWGSKYQALDLFLRKTVSFLPLGILAAMTLPAVYARRSFWGVVVAAILLATLVEAGRYFLPSHGPSVTDVLLQAAGAWIGFLVCRHVRTLLWAERTLHGFHQSCRF